jgi:transcriptional regulator with XRE-family HTH domain
MRRAKSSSKRDVTKTQSRKRDSFTPLGHILRATREQKGLTQKALADSLGLRQRQISDLERAAMDPRFSTVQDVARALELEVALVPRHLVSTIEGLQRRERGATTPMYALDGLDALADDRIEESYRTLGRAIERLTSPDKRTDDDDDAGAAARKRKGLR